MVLNLILILRVQNHISSPNFIAITFDRFQNINNVPYILTTERG